ncbi:hypothetical protein C1Y63_04085 [Corynebacterium sp. 13CS0277]|uniref:HNH endonuclease signature motif containing protein n=1 Tax=Corynebacterium sp. 13CS0277 TaxID=2071994 RepID=UPI000D035E77|nr:HNH endonuclease signature motif containing protein [Corynebacterium sp. 13CS0277]PRQ11829.1 hypothetical protein C1Y63_04085 [Corynebacterium sp. 13CS0277]
MEDAFLATIDYTTFDQDVADKLERLKHEVTVACAIYSATAAKNNAGDLVQSPHAEDFYVERYDMAPAAARAQIRRGEQLIAPQKDAKEREAQARIRGAVLAGEISVDAFDTVMRGTRKQGAPYQAAEYYLTRRDGGSLKQLADTMKRTTPSPERVYAKRSFEIHAQDEQGGCRVRGYLPPDYAARLQSQLDAAMANDYRGDDEDRSRQQRSADALVTLASGDTQAQLVVSVTAKELDEGCDGLIASTGDVLQPEEAARIIDDSCTWLAIHDPIHGVPLFLGRTRRLAGAHQRLALWLHQSTCAYPGCDVPAHRCQVHHLRAWKDGGGTDLDNLIYVCAHHHGYVDDSRSKPHRGYFARDPVTRRPVWVTDGQRENTHPATRTAAARRV